MGEDDRNAVDPAPRHRDPETEAKIDRCVQLHTSLSLSEEFLNTHQQAIADLYVAAGLPLPFPEDRREAWMDTHRQIALAMEIMRDYGLSEKEIVTRLQACHEERAYPTDPRHARQSMLARLAGKGYILLSRIYSRLGWKLRVKGPRQRDLYH